MLLIIIPLVIPGWLKLNHYTIYSIKSFRIMGFSHEDLSIDESRAPYYGRHSCKQFICAKPVKFGYKLWVLASASGVPYNVEIYAGKSSNDTGEPLGTCVVKNELEVCERPSNHRVCFDNFSSSCQLLSDLDKEGFWVTGTMRKSCDEISTD